jgi:hypothetical protein
MVWTTGERAIPGSSIPTGWVISEKVVARTGYFTTKSLVAPVLIVRLSFISHPVSKPHPAGEICNEWQSWSQYLNVRSTIGQSLLQSFVYIALGVLFAGIASLLVVTYAPYAFHTGIPEVIAILSGYVLDAFLSPWTLLIKALGVAMAVASGLSLGKEGPLVHIACCVAHALAGFFPEIRGNEGCFINYRDSGRVLTCIYSQPSSKTQTPRSCCRVRRSGRVRFTSRRRALRIRRARYVRRRDGHPLACLRDILHCCGRTAVCRPLRYSASSTVSGEGKR